MDGTGATATIPISASPTSDSSTAIATATVLNPAISTADDIGNPFFLHSSDNPGAILVSSPLVGDNFISWQRSMTIALSAKNKLGFVDGSIKEPSPDDPEHNTWKRVNHMVLSWLLNSIHRDLVSSVLYTDSAAVVWFDLKERFSPADGPRIYSLERSIASYQQQHDSVAKYFNTLKGYWDELAQYEQGVSSNISAPQQRRQLMQFLMGLNDTYSTVRSQILLMEPLPSVTRAYSLILQDESHRSLHQPAHHEVSAMFSKVAVSSGYSSPNDRGSKTKERCPHCSSYGHSKDQCRKLQGEKCSYCHIVGHAREQCYKLNGYPPHYKRTFQRSTTLSAQPQAAAPALTAEQYAQLMKLLHATTMPQTNMAGPQDESCDWAGP